MSNVGEKTRIRAPETVSAMAEAARAFVATLDAERRERALYPFASAERENWHYVPRPRNGLARRDMTDAQLAASEALIRASASESGASKALAIMDNETLLGDIERAAGTLWHDRDPGLYMFTVFGEPGPNAGDSGGRDSGDTSWGWRVEGHHVSLNYAVFGDELVAVTPSFLGANRAQVLHGAHKGRRILPDEEELGRALFTSLDDLQRNRAVIYPSTPREFFTRNSRRVEIAKPLGFPASLMTGDQRERLMALIRIYVDRKPADVATQALRSIEADGVQNIVFGWAGSVHRFQPHYYRLHGPAFYAEYDNTQDNANHIHSVWRDVPNDFGADILADHYAASH
jgi:hypothetical protein